MEPFQQLERDWAEFNALDPAGMVACASGTAALHLALEALQLPPGAEVVTGDFSMIAVPRAVAMAGLTPVFVDCDERLLMYFPWLYDKWEYVNTAIVRGIRAVVVVHVYGRQVDVEPIAKFCSPGMQGSDGLKIVEDLAEVHGVRPHPSTDAATWSFYLNKIIAGQEGGAVWFRDPARAAYARQLRSLGFTDAHDFNHVPRGHNYRMSNAHAELILKSLANYPTNLARRRGLEAVYQEACPPEWRMPPRDAPWVYDLRVPGMTVLQQDAVVNALKMAGIAARHAFKPMSWQSEFAKCRRVGGSNAGLASKEVIYMPLTPDGTVTEASCRRAFEVIRRALGK